MKRLFILLLVFLLVACGGKDQGKEEIPLEPDQETVEEETEEPVEVVKYIESDEEEFDWPAPNPEEDFVIDKESGTITEYKGNASILVIPDKVDGVQVKVLGDELFYENHGLTHVYIPDGVELIDRYCFNSCFNIVKLRLPSDLQVLGPMALFGLNQLEEITFPKTLLYLDFASMGFTPELKKISFLGEFPAIHYEAFTREVLEDVVFRVADEEKEDFERFFEMEVTTDGACNYLDDLAQDEDLDIKDGILLSYKGEARSISLPQGLVKIGKEAFLQSENLIRVKLPASLEEIEEAAFQGTGLHQVKFQEGLKKIGPKAFSGAKLVDLVLPSSLESLGERAFPQLDMKTLSLPEGLKELPKDCFTLSSIYRINFPSSLEKIGEEALANNSRLSYLVFDGYEPPKIHEKAFLNSGLDDIDIPWDATKAQAEAYSKAFEKQELASDYFDVWRADHPSAPNYPMNSTFVFDEDEGLIAEWEGEDEEMTIYWNFYSSEIEDYLIPVMGIADGVFEKSQLKRFYVPHSNEFRTIGKRAFAESQLEEIYLFDSMEAIYDEAFKNCKQLKEVVIPEGLRYIGKQAFAGCDDLESVIFKGKDVYIQENAFKGCDKLAQLVLPLGVELDGSLGLDPQIITFDDKTSDEDLERLGQILDLPWYLTARRQKDPQSFVMMPDSDFTKAEDFEFDKTTGTITKYKGEKDKKVVVPREIDGVEVNTIGNLAFFMMSIESGHELKEVVLPETIRNIEDGAFLICETLEKFTCYGPVDLVGNRAFEDAISLKEVNFVNGVKELDIYTFNQCQSLEKVNLPLLKDIPEGAFCNCGLKGELRLDFETIGYLSFQNCESITKLVLGDKLKQIGEAAFSGATGLKEVVFERIEGLEFVGLSHFYGVENCDFILPKGTSEAGREAFIQLLNSTGHYGLEDRVKIGN